ncbi:MAG: c-type cytochrome [Candidatus Tumulicola sp.]
MNTLPRGRHLLMFAAVGCATLVASCDRTSGGSTAGVSPLPEPGAGALADVPLGVEAGSARNLLAAQITNPYANDPQAVQQGRDLYIKMNCAGCHGYGAKGGIGPNLTDGYWRYGGVPASIFNSIYQGRPQGMPAWNPALPPQDIWKLVAYIQSLGGSYPADQYQTWLQGDRPGENVPPAADPTPVSSPAASTPEPKDGAAKPPSVAPTTDVTPPPGTGQ